jgi:hypothetical protein
MLCTLGKDLSHAIVIQMCEQRIEGFGLGLCEQGLTVGFLLARKELKRNHQARSPPPPTMRRNDYACSYSI